MVTNSEEPENDDIDLEENSPLPDILTSWSVEKMDKKGINI